MSKHPQLFTKDTPGVVAYFEVICAIIFVDWPGSIDPLNFIFGLGILGLHNIFYLTLVLFLGTIFDDGGPVIGIALGVSLGSMFLVPMLPFLIPFTPTALLMPSGDVSEGDCH